MNRKNALGLLAIVAVAASIGSAAAYGGFFGFDPGNGNEIIDAIKAKDFNAWKEAITARLTEENFNKLVERHEKMSQRHGNMSEKLGARYPGIGALNEDMIKAVKDGDYEAWKTAAVNANSPLLSKITTEDQFKILVQLYQAKQDGNYELAKELGQQLGLPVGIGRHRMHGYFGR